MTGIPNNTNPKDSPKRDNSLKKINKPLMEKKRRARINNCLTQLKVLILEAMKQNTPHVSKLEKADILEMTVQHLKNIQNTKLTTLKEESQSRYADGFRDCATEVIRYLDNVNRKDEHLMVRIGSHLNNCAQRLQGPTGQLSSTSCSPNKLTSPLRIEIPQNVKTETTSPSESQLLMPVSSVCEKTRTWSSNNLLNLATIASLGRVQQESQSFRSLPHPLKNESVGLVLPSSVSGVWRPW